jgi:hypothetical protein
LSKRALKLRIRKRKSESLSVQDSIAASESEIVLGHKIESQGFRKTQTPGNSVIPMTSSIAMSSFVVFGI